MAMKAARVEQLVWVLIYGGLIAVGLGIAARRSDDTLGWALVVAGGVATALGIVLVWVRSRMKGEGEP